MYSESLGIPADATAEGKLLSRWRVLDVQWALCTLERLSTRPDGALGKIALCHARQTLEVVVAGIAEVCRTKAEVDGH